MVVVFRSRIRPENAVEFNALADQLMPMAESMPGFVSYKVFVADDGERCSIIEFETAEELLAWRELAEHRQAQALGRERYYERYSLQVAEVDRESRFDRKSEGR
jgi:heme-degrading monooxygenase HmoA